VRVALNLAIDGSIDTTIERASALRARGITNFWASQIFGPDTLTVLALVGRELRDVNLGTAVVPVQPRHPSALAAQARTVQDALGGSFTLGVGLSHQVVVEGLWGMAFDRPASYMAEYLAALGPMLKGEAVNVHGERVTAVTTGTLGPRDVPTPGLVVAALGPKMLELAGSLTDGTVLWMTGPRTIASHIVPVLGAAADRAGRPAPRVVCSLPIVVTSDESDARSRLDRDYATYGTLPSYVAMLEREGASGPGAVSVVGTHEQVLEKLNHLASVGVTEFAGAPSGTPDERDAAIEALVAYQRAI